MKSNLKPFTILTSLYLVACGVAAGNPDRPTGKLYIDKRYPPAATAGTPLTLEGRNFGVEQGTVRIGRQSVNVLSWTADKVVVETPASETTACESVTVVSADGEKSNVVSFAHSNRSLLIPNSDVPIGRARPLSVWTGEQFIVWGGDTNTGGRYNPLTDTWLPISTVGAPPPPLGIFDKGAAFWTGKVMLVLAGHDPRRFLGDEFKFAAAKYDPRLDEWSVIAYIDGPRIGEGASAVWTGKEMIVWGEDGGARFDPEFDRWSPIAGEVVGDLEVTKTLKRKYHSAVWTGAEMSIWGGEHSNHVLGNGARYNPKTDRWVPISMVNAPSARTGHQSAWTGEEMVVWGGSSQKLSYIEWHVQQSGARYNPRTDSWTPMPKKEAPAGGIGAATVWTGKEWVVYGGQTGHYWSGGERGGASFDPSTNQWKPLPSANQPGGRALATAVWTGSDILLWGGVDESGALTAKGARFNVQNRKWAPIAAVGGEPQQRAGFSAVWTGTEMIVWGGYTAGANVSPGIVSGGRYDPVINQWRPTSSAPAGTGRAFHDAVWTGSEMLITPSKDRAISQSKDRQGLSYQPHTDEWRWLSMAGAPTVGSNPGAVWTGEKMIVWGTSGGGMYAPIVDTWYPMSISGAPSGRSYTRPVWTGKVVIVYGGGEQEDFLQPNGGYNSGGQFNPATNEWAPMPNAEFLSIGAENAAIWTGQEFVIIGVHQRGQRHDPVFEAQGGRFNPETNEWYSLSLTGAPISYSPNAVWTGREIVVLSEPRTYDPITGFQYSMDTDSWSPMRFGCDAYDPWWFKLRFLFGARQKAVWTGSNVQIWGIYGGFTYQP